ncbi:sigma-54-dependent transcriptional regulator [Bradyrhizobium sp.]|uniref:sigma-54-dependent transcriptional regulator n=1 Tax=Bradyrhizobium sp. TaxID=376 RepID=UPI004037E157
MADKILIVDDDATIRETLAEFLAKQGYEVREAVDGAGAVKFAREIAFELIFLDLRLPDANGVAITQTIREFDDYALIVIMTAYPEVRTAIAALKGGAYDYLNKPFDLDDLKGLIHRALETQRLRNEVERLRANMRRVTPLNGLIGSSPSFLSLLEITRMIAAAGRTPVLIRGETGTGKERIAQAIHSFSPRAKGPWITVNCSAIAENLLESEMFGHEKGAFTDAKARKRGLLELADGGTMFLDEIGDLSISLQPKLLRALETQSFRRVGGHSEITVDVRFVAATNRDLPAMVCKGQFREDLYYRINVASIDVPPLRERKSDVLPLAEYFLDLVAKMTGLRAPALAPETAELLQIYSWPGNVRELRNVIERSVILANGRVIAPDHLPKEILARGYVTPTHKEEVSDAVVELTIAEMERRHIINVVRRCGNNKTQAAKHLGISRLTLRTKLRQFGLDALLGEEEGGGRQISNHVVGD